MGLEFTPLPLWNSPLQYHESWILSFFYNYFPFSLIVEGLLFVLAVKLFFAREKTFLGFYILIFIVGSFAIPFLYVFPLNFIFILFLYIHLRLDTATSLQCQKIESDPVVR